MKLQTAVFSFWLSAAFLLLTCCSPPASTDHSVFRMSIKNEPPTLDWALATDSISFTILTNLMEGLTQYDSELNPQPAIAKNWEYSEDGRTITFFLRNDVTWSDGNRSRQGTLSMPGNDCSHRRQRPNTLTSSSILKMPANIIREN